ncbi:MAG TPA: maltose alpha-D-glucosyltransferase [Edaphocola sp.]|nr:maltose alpha-D-glucosyltransferase [Edaphocola sp.]
MDNTYWYKDAVIYELHLKAFSDSNADGIGDLRGLMEKLDYLKDLGITAIWLLPFYPSPLRDDGYDIADYYSINPAYGDINDFIRFMDEAHARGLKVITELVVNHTSDQHPWFQRARIAEKGSKERNFYVWTDDPKQYKDVRVIFQDYENSNWSWDPVANQHYWHRFFYHQPDLNFDNPDVQEEVFKILDFWCAMGVDGFRLDAVPYLFEREGTNGENLPETHLFLKKLRAHVDEYYPGTLLLAEANMWPDEAAAYFGDGDECQMNYHFPLMPRMFMALQMEDRYPITDIFDQTPDIPRACQWAIFLRNHDELTLEMVTDEERDYMYKVYVTDSKALINLGIRRRLAPLMQNNRRKIELIYSLLFSLPGTPVIYYGDEIGMGDNFYLGDRNGVRTPMQWSSDRNGGFSKANPHKLYVPMILDQDYHFESVNVEAQSANTSSLLWYMKRIISLRKKHQAFGRGDFTILFVDNPKILAFTRAYEEEIILVVVNLSRYIQPAEIDLKNFEGYIPVELQSRNKFPVIKDTGYFLSLGGYDFQWFSLIPVVSVIKQGKHSSEYILQGMEDICTGDFRKILVENILPEWLKNSRWFGGRKKSIRSIEMEDKIMIPLPDGESVLWALFKVFYYYGLPEIYQLPLVFIAKEKEDFLRNYPQSIVSPVNLDGREGFLCDALFDQRLHAYVLHQMLANRETGHIRFYGTGLLYDMSDGIEELNSRMLNAEQSNTSVVFDNKLYLKFYRKLDYDINPDVEMTRMLTEELSFEFAPPFLGTIELTSDKGKTVLAMMQQMVESSGDAWQYMLEKLDIFNERVLAAGELPKPQYYGSLTHPYHYEELYAPVRALFDPTVARQAALIGERVAEMHLLLASLNNMRDFKPEPYSLHYQRSIFSSLSALVRESFDNLEKNLGDLPEEVAEAAREVLALRPRVLQSLKKVYDHKMDLLKIRIHGDFHLGQVLFTGKDLMILDFEGEPAKRYSERRLKFAALRDVAGMVRSFYYVAFASLFLDTKTRREDIKTLIPYVEMWSYYMSGFFLRSYLEKVKGSQLVPEAEGDIGILLDVFLSAKALYELNYELNNRPDWVIIPIKGILNIFLNETIREQPDPASETTTDHEAS